MESKTKIFLYMMFLCLINSCSSQFEIRQIDGAVSESGDLTIGTANLNQPIGYNPPSQSKQIGGALTAPPQNNEVANPQPQAVVGNAQAEVTPATLPEVSVAAVELDSANTLINSGAAVVAPSVAGVAPIRQASEVSQMSVATPIGETTLAVPVNETTSLNTTIAASTGVNANASSNTSASSNTNTNTNTNTNVNTSTNATATASENTSTSVSADVVASASVNTITPVTVNAVTNTVTEVATAVSDLPILDASQIPNGKEIASSLEMKTIIEKVETEDTNKNVFNPDLLMCSEMNQTNQFTICSNHYNNVEKNLALNKLILTGIDFTRASFENVSIANTNLEASSFKDAKFASVDFESVNLIYSDFSNAQISSSNIADEDTYEELIVAGANIDKTTVLPDLISKFNQVLAHGTVNIDGFQIQFTNYDIEEFKNYQTLLNSNRTEAKAYNTKLQSEKKNSTECKLVILKHQNKIKKMQKLESMTVAYAEHIEGKVAEKKLQIKNELDEKKKLEYNKKLEDLRNAKNINAENFYKIKTNKNKLSKEDHQVCMQANEISRTNISEYKDHINGLLDSNFRLWSLIEEKMDKIVKQGIEKLKVSKDEQEANKASKDEQEANKAVNSAVKNNNAVKTSPSSSKRVIKD